MIPRWLHFGAFSFVFSLKAIELKEYIIDEEFSDFLRRCKPVACVEVKEGCHLRFGHSW